MIIHPNQIFLIDALGALLTALLLLFLLAPLQGVFGMPRNILFLLSTLAFCLAIYSYRCYRKAPQDWTMNLKRLILFNSLYIFISLTLVIQNFNLLSIAGKTYFGLEMIIIGLVIIIEYRTLKQKNL